MQRYIKRLGGGLQPMYVTYIAGTIQRTDDFVLTALRDPNLCTK
jgi:hypothetical protein